MPSYSNISTFSPLSACSTFFWFISLFLSVNLIFGSGHIMVSSQSVTLHLSCRSPAVCATCFTACCRSATRSAHNRLCLAVSNVVTGFVLTLLITFQKTQIKKRMWIMHRLASVLQPFQSYAISFHLWSPSYYYCLV